jgi:hypothetical protein
MNVRSLLPLSLAAAGACLMCNCSTLKSTAAKVGALSRQSVAKVGDLLPSRRPPVVEVREKDLKDLPLGHERALAYQEKKRAGWWFFSGPVDFKEPDLPDTAAEMTGTLLPPKGE